MWYSYSRGEIYMETKKIIVDDEEVEIYSEITDEEMEDNRDIFKRDKSLEDTIKIDVIKEKTNNGDING
jgi:hypothetical protein